ncbi:MAG: hypothetical protein JWO42_3671 [Chloroflexi bacterium]|nr:hypothetical protein [Chloroflexota bacterium]
MNNEPNRIQEQSGEVSDRQPTSPEAQGPLDEAVNAATKYPASSPPVPEGSEVNSGWRRRDAIWPEVHDPFDTDLHDVDPRATGDPIGPNRP